MKHYFENKCTYNQISFYLTDKPTIDEREIHPYHEILFYIDGKTTLLTAGGHVRLKKLSLIMIPAETYHFLKQENESGFMRLKISFPTDILKDTPLSGIMDKLRIVEEFGEEIQFIFDTLCNILRENKENTAFYAYAAFLMLIAALDRHGMDTKQKLYTETNRLTMRLTDYISENLSADLGIQTLSKIMHVSPSGITHVFKKEVGIPIHKYILQKRLIYARKRILEGAQPSKIFTEAGFRDYSSFYKAYIQYFGYAPSKEK